ncbi:MAG: hypothetical protein ACUVXA_13290 [Candidatus Jordarchaeum sp.]|uniref:hypothetical protein n=1 Tax=Candidatus Jordarchaeum sp. TaxID=2823881 RepID=UPI00404AE2F9
MPSVEELLEKAKSFYPKHPDLMKYLETGALWEYRIRPFTLDSGDKLVFHLTKLSEKEIRFEQGPAPEKPDLILYFTENAMVKLVDESNDVDTYYENYREILKNPDVGVELDYKINKPRLKLFRMGYKEWANTYKFQAWT